MFQSLVHPACRNGSQFFITYKAHQHLNGKYTVFGHVIDGMPTPDKMERVPVGEKASAHGEVGDIGAKEGSPASS